MNVKLKPNSASISPIECSWLGIGPPVVIDIDAIPPVSIVSTITVTAGEVGRFRTLWKQRSGQVANPNADKNGWVESAPFSPTIFVFLPLSNFELSLMFEFWHAAFEPTIKIDLEMNFAGPSLIDANVFHPLTVKPRFQLMNINNTLP